MAGFFNLPSARSTTKRDMKIAQKSKKAQTMNTITIKGTGTLIDKIQSIVSLVNSKFAKKKDQFILIRDEQSFINYIDKCVENGVISIDTETTGLDPIEDHIVGLCIYTPGMKAAYVPVNHISYITQLKVDNQLPIEFLREQMERINTENVKTIWFNAPFDIRFIKHTIGVLLTPYWDASIASRILYTEEPRGGRGLKQLHKKYCSSNKGEAFSFGKLFDDIPFNLIPVNTAYLYAANDAVITYELYKFQEYYLDPNYEGYKTHHMEGPSNVFFNIEMKSMPVFIEMEENGVVIDVEYAKTISEKYHAYADKIAKRAEEVLSRYKDEIDDYIRHTPTTRLTNPINIGSSVQLSELLYDVFKIPPPDPKKPRGTGDDILERIDHPLVDVIRDQRFFDKQLSTYVDKIPSIIHADGRVHCRFNQYGADCRCGKDLLLTDKGYRRIDSLFSGEEQNGKFYDCDEIIYNRYFQQEKTSAKIAFYNTPTIKLTLRGGWIVEGTPNHPIICSAISKTDIVRNKSDRQIKRLSETHDFRKLEDIQIGDTVVIPYGFNIFPTEYIETNLNLVYNHQESTLYKMPKYFNEEFAEFLGMYFADGYYKLYDDRFSVCLCNDDLEVIDRFKYLVNSLFGVECYISDSNHTKLTIFNSTSFKELVKYLDKGARNKKIPQEIMNSPKTVICAFIRGMTLDSEFDMNRQRLYLNCVDEVSNHFVKEVLANIGILTSVSHGIYKSGNDHCNNDVEQISVERIGIVGEMYKKFLDEIGVIESKKRFITDNYKKSQYLCNDNYYYAYVEKIEQTINDVYDLTVPNTHSFICGGVINHNTGRVSSDSPKIIFVNWAIKIQLIQGRAVA